MKERITEALALLMRFLFFRTIPGFRIRFEWILSRCIARSLFVHRLFSAKTFL
jgi:hypothetical protein